eukprot:s3318_g6.t1
MFNRIQRARDLAVKRSMVEAAQEQYRRDVREVSAVPIPPQPNEKEKAEHMLTHTPFQPWCEYCVRSRSRANQHPHVADPTHDAQREHPTIQCDFFFMEAGKEDAMVALLMVDVWSRYVAVMPLKPRNTQTVGNASVKFLSDVGRIEKTEIAGDNEPVLAAGMRFCQKTRQMLGLETILTWNRTYEKTRTSIAERFVQTVRGLQKTLIVHLEAAIQATIPAGHAMVQWAAMHAAWAYNRFQVHSSLRATPFQSLFGRPYKGKIVCFGQTVFGLDPNADKYRPAWMRGAWLGKESADMDLISTDGQTVVKTKAVRRIGEEWDAALVLGVDMIPSQVFGHRQVKNKQTIIPLAPPQPQQVDEAAEAVRDFVSEGYSPSEGREAPDEAQLEDAQTWENAGLENPFSPMSPTTMECDQGSGSQVMYLKKRMTMRPDGILLQPNSTYIPKLVALMKVSGRRKRGLPYHATLESFNADLVIESEMLDVEQASVFRSGLSALKHLVSHLDGTADGGLLLQCTKKKTGVSLIPGEGMKLSWRK